MSDFAFKAYDGFETSQKKSDSKSKILKILFAILLSLLLIEVVVYLFVVPALGNVRISISGLNNCSEQEIV